MAAQGLLRNDIESMTECDTVLALEHFLLQIPTADWPMDCECPVSTMIGFLPWVFVVTKLYPAVLSRQPDIELAGASATLRALDDTVV